MATKEIRVENLVGKPVRSPDGEVIGRIQEVKAEWHGRHCVVTEIHVGKAALLERLSLRPPSDVKRIPVAAIDFTDPTCPRLRKRL